MIALKNLIQPDRGSDTAIYIQVHNGIVKLIKSGVLKSGAKLPGTRSLSIQLGLHRKTVIAAYEELMSQGWVNSVAAKGTFVSDKLPIVGLGHGVKEVEPSLKAGFSFQSKTNLHRSNVSLKSLLTIDEGIPDVRIAPITEILRNYRAIASRSYNAKYLGYGSFYGDDHLREVLAYYLQETRGITCTKENVLITRGSQMGIYLSAQLIHKSSGGCSVVGETNYIAASLTLADAGAELLFARVDEQGINTDDIEIFCQKYKVKSVYVTSHHHHPTTVTLSPERRLRLIHLAEKYRFAILEDDYDYDFHYQHAPLLPLASSGGCNNVVYMGAVCKIIAPAIRVGYMVGPADFVKDAAHFRRTIDRQGDTILERSIANMIEQGDLQRHSRKALKVYRKRRGNFGEILKANFSEILDFNIPEGGMAYWVRLNKSLSWKEIEEQALAVKLKIPHWKDYDINNLGHNGIRMGFASLDEDEQVKTTDVFKSVILKTLQK